MKYQRNSFQIQGITRVSLCTHIITMIDRHRQKKKRTSNKHDKNDEKRFIRRK
jgi:hypothetical protein